MLLLKRHRCGILLKSLAPSLQAAGFIASCTLLPLHTTARQELGLLASLAPLLASNVAAPFSEHAFASDASLKAGAYTTAHVGSSLSAALWLSADSKGFYTKLDEAPRAALASFGVEPLEDVQELAGPSHSSSFPHEIPKPLGQIFDFIEICGGAGRVTQKVAEAGYVCGPVFDLSYCAQFDLLSQSEAIALLKATTGETQKLWLGTACICLLIATLGRLADWSRCPARTATDLQDALVALLALPAGLGWYRRDLARLLRLWLALPQGVWTYRNWSWPP